MPMTTQALDLAGLFVLLPDVREAQNARFTYFHDERELAALGADGRCVQEHASFYPLRHTVRGLHFQTAPGLQTKYVRVARGSVRDVVVDLRAGSPTFGRHASLRLAAGDWRQLHVPPGFGHGFCTLEDDTEVVFRLTAFNDPALLRGVRWNDPALGIDWPCGDTPAWLLPIDAQWPLLADLATPFEWRAVPRPQ
jgi:dTDP-4-dehydrorhamnose 3,5-epimerase